MEERAATFEVGPLNWETPRLSGFQKEWIVERFLAEADEWRRAPTWMPNAARGASGKHIAMRLMGDKEDALWIIKEMYKVNNVNVIMDTMEDGTIVMTCMEVVYMRY